MKTFISDIFPKVQRYSEKLDNLTLLTNQHWVSIDNITSSKTVYIFRSNGELIVSTNGAVEKAKWEYLGHKSLLIDQHGNSYLFKHGFFDKNILALKVDSRDEYAVFVNENKYEGDINSMVKVVDFLKEKYLDPAIAAKVEEAIGVSSNNQGNEEDGLSMIKYSDAVDPKAENLFRIIILVIVILSLFIVIGTCAMNSHN